MSIEALAIGPIWPVTFWDYRALPVVLVRLHLSMLCIGRLAQIQRIDRIPRRILCIRYPGVHLLLKIAAH